MTMLHGADADADHGADGDADADHMMMVLMHGDA